ncbi:hypothetical protein Dda_3803 [Drechslerella dactyloides]|uniref:Uncharacterized protein n=1 Tax=Drechslerella dactyloides TaxID=74499 RepID=A0AAD6IZF5_DREDA|nr:hypothetical protein Dda_3803 [Drechslerella dactyloides]
MAAVGGNASLHRIIPNPPPPTPEERRAKKINSFKLHIEDFNDPKVASQLPSAYKKSLETGLKAWEDGEAHWIDGHAYLWGPEGLIAQGTIEEIREIHRGYTSSGNRDYHADRVSRQSSENSRDLCGTYYILKYLYKYMFGIPMGFKGSQRLYSAYSI